MDLYNIGFSNIRLPNDKNNYIYKYSPIVNIFPEEVFIHEFLHSLERTLVEYEYEIPALHDSEKYGYYKQNLTGLKDWYRDYMRCNIKAGDKYIGLDEIVYTLKPVHKSDFKYSMEIEFNKESKNFIEDLLNIIKKIKNVFK